MENTTPLSAGTPTSTGSSKAGLIGLAIAMLAIGLVAGYYLGNGKSGDVVSQTAIPTVSISPNSSASSDTTGWKKYTNSTYFNFSFKVPPGFGVEDDQDFVIYIAKGEPYHDMEKGNNIFMSLLRYTGDETQASKLAIVRGATGVTESTTSVDGRSFPLVDYSAPPEHRFYVFFEKFYVQVEIPSSDFNSSIDYLAVGKKILSTFRFTKLSSIPTSTPSRTPTLRPRPIPQSVETKYQEFANTYRNSFGATLKFCKKSGAQSIYLVEGSGGFSGASYYYDVNGKELGRWEWDDMITPGETPPPASVYVSSYSCTVLKKSK